MHVLIIGASRGIGLETVRAALAAGHHVRAFARSANALDLSHPNLETRPGDALNAADVAGALDGVDAVIQALGVAPRDLMRPVSLFSSATRVLLPAMEQAGVRRLIAVTGFGAGDSARAIPCPARPPFRLMLGRAYDDKSVQERLIRDSGLDWTIIRPGILVGGQGCGRARVLVEPETWRGGLVSRADVARVLVRELAEDPHIGAAPVVVW
jgi:uncharacterized protein YbjT (DUF2867 family)